jgi:glutamate--cysteine ligase
MMRATAGVQVNLEAGVGPAQQRERWLLTHRIGPVLVAAFANSPLWQGSPSGWKSTRQLVWTRLDPGRTRPVATDGPAPADWARYALDAGVMCRPCGDGDGDDDWGVPAGLTFRSWLAGCDGLPAPGTADLDYHLTTLFPPVRPRGFLELRMIDAQPGPDGWIVPTLVAATLLDDPRAAAAAWTATEPLCAPGSLLPDAGTWERAARLGPEDPLLREAALACFAAVETAVETAVAGVAADAPAEDPGQDFGRLVAGFAETYLSRGRCPADDQLAALEGVA